MKNTLYCGDNLEVLRKHIKNESIDLAYIDPPFFSNKHYEVVWGDEAEVRSFEDRWEGGINVYIEWMRTRVEELHRVLKPTGSFYLHCDWHASHYLKIMLDEIFGARQFLNEIVWYYGPKATQRSISFQRKHDIVFFYAKQQGQHYFYPPLQEYGKGSLAERRSRYNNQDKQGRYRLTTRRDKAGKKYRAKVYLKEGVIMTDVWTIPVINATAKERLGYPTQKPEALLERIIKASSNEGDQILDAFCGCGTTLVVAQKLKRNWIGIDISPTAVKVMQDRLKKAGAVKDANYVTIGMPSTISELGYLKPFEFQNWAINEMGARQSTKKVGDMGLDGYFVKDLWHEGTGIQVKQSKSVGRNIVDNFKAALQRKKYKKGYIIAFSFTKGAYEEAARLKHDEDLVIELIKVESLLFKKKPI